MHIPVFYSMDQDMRSYRLVYHQQPISMYQCMLELTATYRYLFGQ